jgi:hypothetical protein
VRNLHFDAGHCATRGKCRSLTAEAVRDDNAFLI